ncbi:MAG: hypothetical protein H7Y42_02520 [Chitinophagaceae bacterium]|nr:hypothetical protein [Chitinophagaceae bacterium]
MIKYFLSTGIGMLFCSISFSQLSNADDPVQTFLSENSVKSVSTTPGENQWLELPKDGEVISESTEMARYSGYIKRNRLHGSWQSWYTNQRLCDSGSFFKGVPTGEWKHWSAGGGLLAIRNYDATKLLRVKDEIRRNHPRYSGYPLTRIYKKNRVQAVHYLRAGYSFSFSDQRKYSYSLQDAVKNNITPGNSYRPLFDECLHHGLYMNFYSNGLVKDSGYYNNGLREGLWIHKEATGSYVQGAYRNGVRTGDWKRYDTNNRITAIIIYNKKGVEEWRKTMGEKARRSS